MSPTRRRRRHRYGDHSVWTSSSEFCVSFLRDCCLSLGRGCSRRKRPTHGHVGRSNSHRSSSRCCSSSSASDCSPDWPTSGRVCRSLPLMPAAGSPDMCRYLSPPAPPDGVEKRAVSLSPSRPPSQGRTSPSTTTSTERGVSAKKPCRASDPIVQAAGPGRQGFPSGRSSTGLDRPRPRCLVITYVSNLSRTAPDRAGREITRRRPGGLDGG